MKAVCDRATLTQGIQVAAGIAPHRSPKPILGCVKLDAQEDRITLLATDLEVGIRISLDKMETSESGSALVPADRFHAILRELDAETVTLTTSQQETEIVAPGARFKVLGDDPTEKQTIAAERKVERYSKKTLRRRAITIARTETIRAANTGQHLLWKEAQNLGLLLNMQRQWILTPDDLLCESPCPQMAQQIVGIDQPFITPNGVEVMTPPAHPNCRCATGLVKKGT